MNPTFFIASRSKDFAVLQFPHFSFVNPCDQPSEEQSFLLYATKKMNLLILSNMVSLIVTAAATLLVHHQLYQDPSGHQDHRKTQACCSCSSSSLWMPKASDALTWQWQLSGTVDTSLNVDMYDIDLFDVPVSTIQQLQAQGKKVVCYFSAGSYEGWRSDWPHFFDFITGEQYAGSELPFAGKMSVSGRLLRFVIAE